VSIRICRVFPIVAALLLFSACGGDQTPLLVGGKESAEDQIVAELIAALAEAEGIRVQRRIGLGDSRLTMEALKRGEIDLYPESTGSGLTLLGLAQPATAEPERALNLLRERYAALGLFWSAPLGFESRPGLAMLRERAAALGMNSYSDLAERSNRLVLGVDSEFRERPIDGLGPLRRRYGMSFQRYVEVPTQDRRSLYEYLLDGEVDVAITHSADPQIEMFDLKVLNDDLDFFPRHHAAVVVSESALQRFPALKNILERLAGAISNEKIRALNRQVSVRGEDPGDVVRSELIRLSLIDGEIRETDRQALSLAVSLSANAEGEAATVLRQMRRSFPTSNVNLVRSPDPLGAVAEGSVRLALVSAPAFFAPGSVDPKSGQPPLRQGFEAVALVGTSFLHAFALTPGITSLSDAGSIATGPRGSSGFRAAESVIDGLQLSATITPVRGDMPGKLADALLESGADVAILMQPPGNSTARALLQRGLSLINIDNWTQGNNGIVFPYLQPVRLGPADYEGFLPGQPVADMPGFSESVQTLATQLVLAGPARPEESRLSTQGPGASFGTRALPLTDQVVARINEATGRSEGIYPVLPQARALAPRLPQPPEPLNTSLKASALSLIAIALLALIAVLLLRPFHPE